MSIGAFSFRVFTITALAGCTFTSLYLICSTGCKQNSYDFLGLTTNGHEWTLNKGRNRKPRMTRIGERTACPPACGRLACTFRRLRRNHPIFHQRVPRGHGK